MNLEQFIAKELAESGKRIYTLPEVIELTERWIAYKQSQAEPLTGWKSDTEIDALLGITGAPV